MNIHEEAKKQRKKFDQIANELGHTPKYIEEPGMIDFFECSCGWKSVPYWDGVEYAYRDWVDHVKKESMNTGQKVMNF